MSDLFASLFLFLLSAVCLVFYTYLSWNNKYWIQRGVNAPISKLFSGTFPKSTRGECNFIEELHEIYLQYKSSHRYVGILVARSPKLFILDPKLATEILTQNFASFRDNESSQWTSPSVEKLRLCSPFVTTGDAWKNRRTELTAALTVNRIRAFHSSMRQCASKLVAYIEQQQEMTLNVKELSNRYTAEFMADFIWGIEANAFSDISSSPILLMSTSMIEQAINCVKYYGRTSIFPYLRKVYPVPFFPRSADKFFSQLASEAMQMRRASQLNEERYDVINHLLQLKDKKSISDIQIAGHTTTALIDGFETVAVVIAHCLWLLAREPRVQKKLRAELQATVEKELTFDELNELPYLDQCVQETLRLFPPLTTLFKLCTAAISLKDNDGSILSLKPNDAVYISSYSFHYDAVYYERPMEFWPERFDEALGGIRKYRDMGVFLPFGDGPRICAGMKLGMAEAKAAIAEVVKNFHIKCSPNMRKDNKLQVDCFLLTVDGGIELIFEKI